ncbi:MAG: CoB--CoM heterodisulfide reductase subunit B [Promethearchaeota archaeon]
MSFTKSFAFFLGCIMPNRYPQIEKTTRLVMEKLGVKLYEMEKATCCPAPGVFRSFSIEDWYTAGARNICIAEKLGQDILTVCNGCFGTLNDVNTRLKEDDELRDKVNERLKDIGDYEYKGTIRVRHIGEFLGSEIGPNRIKKYLVKKIKARAAVHYGCHFLKPTRIRQITTSEKPRILEDYIAALGIESVDFKNKLTCCGAGGGVLSSSKDVSMTILGAKMKDIDEVRPDFIFDICPFCHLQFETGQDYLNKNYNMNYQYPVIHISQLTALAMGYDKKYLGIEYQLVGHDFFDRIEVEDIE